MTGGETKPPPPWIKPLTEWGPLAVFFAAYWIYGMMPATGALVVAAVAASLLAFAVERRIPWMPVLTAAAVGIFGSLTLVFDDAVFLKMRPTIVQALMATVLIAGALIGRLFLKSLMARSISISEQGWKILTWRFAAFLLFGAALNELVWRTQSNGAWVTYDTFGPICLTLLFVLAQAPLIKRHATA